MNTKREELLDEIYYFKFLKDGKIDEIIIKNASDFVNLINTEIISDVFPNPNGTISFILKTDLYEIHLEMGKTKMNFYKNTLKITKINDYETSFKSDIAFYNDIEVNNIEVLKSILKS